MSRMSRQTPVTFGKSMPFLSVLFFVVLVSFKEIEALRRTPLEAVLFNEENHQDSQEESHSQQDESHRILSSFPTPESIEEHLVTSLPLLDQKSLPTKHYAGHLAASKDEHDKKFFYWLFEPDLSDHQKKDLSEVPLLIWLNGGPACSSMDGLFLENGPFTFAVQDGKWVLKANEYSWHKAPAYVLYIDQPAGTGLSFTRKKNYCRNDLEVNVDFDYFLQTFLRFYRELFLSEDGVRMNRPLYFSGESHAGHYIPSMMDYILKQNDALMAKNGKQSGDDEQRIYVDLGGAAIGNGWVDPFYQYSASEVSYAKGFISLAQKQAYDDKEKICQNHLQQQIYRSSACFGLLDDIVAQSYGGKSQHVVSKYDTRLVESNRGARKFPKNHKVVEAYLGRVSGRSNPPPIPSGGAWNVNSDEVLLSIHALEATDAKQYYLECTNPPYNALAGQDGLGVVPELVNVLSHPTKPTMLFFNGMNDMVCNHIGNEKFLINLPWENAAKFSQAERFSWYHDSSNRDGTAPSGYWQTFENLHLLKIEESGHMVPMDQPAVALTMMNIILYDSDNGDKFWQNLQSSDSIKQCANCSTCEINL